MTEGWAAGVAAGVGEAGQPKGVQGFAPGFGQPNGLQAPAPGLEQPKTLHVWATEGCARPSKGRMALRTPIVSALLKETDKNPRLGERPRDRFIFIPVTVC